jgi:hypothetical protein
MGDLSVDFGRLINPAAEGQAAEPMPFKKCAGDKADLRHLFGMTDSAATSTPTTGSTRSGCLRWFVATSLLGLIAFGFLSYFFMSSLKEVTAWLSDLPSKFVQNDIETSFRASITM